MLDPLASQTALHSERGLQPGREPHADNPMRAMAELTEEQWDEMLRGARYRSHSAGDVVISQGSTPDGITQVVRGSFRVEVAALGRPQAHIFARHSTGEVLGEMSFLLGRPASATVVVEWDDSATVRFSRAYLLRLFQERPDIGSTYYCFLATRAAERLKVQTSKVRLLAARASAAGSRLGWQRAGGVGGGGAKEDGAHLLCLAACPLPLAGCMHTITWIGGGHEKKPTASGCARPLAACRLPPAACRLPPT